MAKPLTDEQRQLRINLVEALVAYAKEMQDPAPEYAEEVTKQIKRIAKFLCVSN
jgi:hypothetical protein